MGRFDHLATQPVRGTRDILQWKVVDAIAGRNRKDPDLTRLVRDLLEREVVGRIADHLGGPDATARAGAFGAQLAGLIFVRYILAVEPVASMPPDELIRYLAPGLRAAVHSPSRRSRMR
jgi:hypothetical protein